VKRDAETRPPMREGSGGTSKVTNECSDSMRPRPELSPVSAGRSFFASFD